MVVVTSAASAAATAMVAVTSAASAAMVAVTSAASAAVPVTPAAMAVADKFNGGLGRPHDVFLIEDIERRQGNVGDFLFPEGYLVALSRQSGHIGCRASGNCRCRARQRH
jgi:hypothetical protein